MRFKFSPKVRGDPRIPFAHDGKHEWIEHVWALACEQRNERLFGEKRLAEILDLVDNVMPTASVYGWFVRGTGRYGTQCDSDSKKMCRKPPARDGDDQDDDRHNVEINQVVVVHARGCHDHSQDGCDR